MCSYLAQHAELRGRQSCHGLLQLGPHRHVRLGDEEQPAAEKCDKRGGDEEQLAARKCDGRVGDEEQTAARRCDGTVVSQVLSHVTLLI